MAAAAAFPSAVRKVFDRPHAYFTTAASAEVQRRLLPRNCHGGSTLRRLSSSQSANLVTNNNKGAKTAAATMADDVPPPGSPLWIMKLNDQLSPHSPIWKMKLSNLPPDSPIWNMKLSVPPWCPAHLMYVHHLLRWAAGTVAFTSALVYLMGLYMFKDPIVPVDIES